MIETRYRPLNNKEICDLFNEIYCLTVSLFELIEDKVERIVEDFYEDFRNFDDDFEHLELLVLILRLIMYLEILQKKVSFRISFFCLLPFPSNDRLLPLPSRSLRILLRISSKRKSQILIRDVFVNSLQSKNNCLY